MNETVKEVEKEFKLKVEVDAKDKNIYHIKFEDKRAYKFQMPDFMDLHKWIMSDNSDHEMFENGLECLFPNAEGCLQIDEAYLNGHKREGIYLWSKLIRGLLLGSS